ncbi:DUF4419 domain-containing protein [Aerosakkonema funiforme]|uniref:DUF4419 domain-containing protein n=1 Tax=Aerosakkonema funiforme TaxID=1246630 RepID=UPI0035B9D537
MNDIASIITQRVGEICFQVDDVKPCQDLVAEKSALLQFEKFYGSPVLAFSHHPEFPLVENTSDNALVSAVHIAFSQHRPLLLTPDAIWMTIAQGFAHHINNNAEALRSRFVRHQGKIVLKSETEELTQPHHWEKAIEQWVKGIRAQVGADLCDLMECNFSTTTPRIRTASHVVMMDAFQQYFDYFLMCICGIPFVTLQGTVDDWRSIQHRVEKIAEYELDWWTQRLLPICQGFLETAEGKPSLSFWRQIYKPKSVYGGEVITGWLANLFPYLKESKTKAPKVRNPILNIARTDITVEDGISTQAIPVGLSCAPFKLKTEQGEKSLELVAGFIGIKQDSDNGTLQPEIGWAVREQDKFTKLLDLLEQEHETLPPLDRSGNNDIYIPDMPGELIQLLERFNGATLFAHTEHSWRVRSVQDYLYMMYRLHKYGTAFIDLNDGRCIAYAYVSRSTGNLKDGTYKHYNEWWMIVGQPMSFWDSTFKKEYKLLKPQNSAVIAKGIPQLFERIIQAEGRYYFDAPDFIPDDSFDEGD